ncbi:MAG: alcohol dehydrogenase catalytic domain-containing protein [Chloroflexi bacterium]|nr:alcohol dehydrogenase catalytic domain-containing protein [Chloroflexota bacterium]
MSLPSTSRCIVQTGARSLELRELPIPPLAPDAALLRVDACGICGSDYEQYQGVMPGLPFPLIPGHEPVGTIVEMGDEAAERWDVQVGDRVCVETLLPCGACRQCRSGKYRLCSGRRGLSGYGYLSIDSPPGLWGAYAEYLYLDPHTVVHPISKEIPPELATLFNPLGAGIRWAVHVPGTKLGDTIVILGPGQRGLASVIAAREAGAACIIVSGLSADERKLALAREFGADHTIDVEREDIVQRVREITDGELADVVIDVSAYANEPVTQAIDVARRGGTVVLAGLKGPKPVEGFYNDRVVAKELTIKGVFGVDFQAYEPAIRLIESGKYPLEKMHTHTMPLEEAERAIQILAREIPGEEAIHIALVP